MQLMSDFVYEKIDSGWDEIDTEILLCKIEELRDTIEKQQIIDAADNWIAADPMKGEDYYNKKYKTL